MKPVKITVKSKRTASVDANQHSTNPRNLEENTPPVDTNANGSELGSVEASTAINEPLDSLTPPSLRKPERKQMEITLAMEEAIAEAKRSIKDKMKKAEAAREVYDALKGHDRRQVIHVFIAGCGLSKAGASTYYQNCKLRTKGVKGVD